MIKCYFHDKKDNIYCLDSTFNSPSLIKFHNHNLLKVLEGKQLDSFEGCFDINDINVLSLEESETKRHFIPSGKKNRNNIEEMPLINQNLEKYVKAFDIEDIAYIKNSVYGIIHCFQTGSEYLLLDLSKFEDRQAILLAYFVCKVFTNFPILLYIPSLSYSEENIELITDFVPDVFEVERIDIEDPYSKGFDVFVDDVTNVRKPDIDLLVREQNIIYKEPNELNLIALDRNFENSSFIEEEKKEEIGVAEIEDQPLPPLKERIETRLKTPLSNNDKNNLANYIFLIIFLGLSIVTAPVFFYYGQGSKIDLMFGICFGMSSFFVLLSSLPVSYLFTDSGKEKINEVKTEKGCVLGFFTATLLCLTWATTLVTISPILKWDLNRTMPYIVLFYCYPIILFFAFIILLWWNKKKKERKRLKESGKDVKQAS